MARDVSLTGPTKRKLFEESFNGDETAAKIPRLQVKIRRLQLSQEQLKNLRQKSAKHQNTPLIATKEDEKKNDAAPNANTSSSTSTAKTVTAAETTAVKEPVITVEESPVRHRLSNLLDGSSLSPYHGNAAHFDEEEENVKSINCLGDGQLNNAKSFSEPASSESNLFCSEEPLSFDDGHSPLSQEEDYITVPCDPDVVTKTCMQVEKACTQKSSDNSSQAASVATTSVQDKEEDHEENQRMQPASDDKVSNFPEKETEPKSAAPGSCDVALGQVSNDPLPENKKAENVNAEKAGSTMSAEVQDNMIDYASHYNTLEVMNTLLSNLTEERRARKELEQQVSNLEEEKRERESECEKLRDLVNDLLPPSKVKNETVSRGVQINMDLSLRRGRAVDRATSPLKRIREPSPDLSVRSLSIACQTVDPPREVMSIACQTDPLMQARLLAMCTTQTAVPARVQGIVMPNIQERAPVQVATNCTQASNPVQVADSRPPSSFQKQSGQVAAAQGLGMQSQQGQTLRQMLGKQPPQQYPGNMWQTADYRHAAGYHSGTLNSAQVRTSQSSGTVPYAQVPPNHLIPISSLPTTRMSGNQVVVGSNPSAYSGVNAETQRNPINYAAMSAQHAPQSDKSNQTTGQRLNLNGTTSTQFLAQNQLLTHNTLSALNKIVLPAQSTPYNSRPVQYVGTQHRPTHQQMNPTIRSQVSAIQGKSNVMLHYNNEIRRQLAAALLNSSRNSQQPSGTSLPSRMASNQAATLQHTEGQPLQRQFMQREVSQSSPASLQNAQRLSGTFPQRRVTTNQSATPQHTAGRPLQHQVMQPEASLSQLQVQASHPSLQNLQKPSGTFSQNRMAYNQVPNPQHIEGLPLQHQVFQPEASEARRPAQPNSALVQQNVSRMIRQQSDQIPSSTQTSNSNNDLATRLHKNALEQRARSPVESQSLYSEFRLVYNELQKSFNENTSLDKQSTTTQASGPLDNQLNQQPSSKNTPPSDPVSSVSEQSPVNCHIPGNQFQGGNTSQVNSSQTVMEMPHSDRSLSEGADKHSVHFSQEADASVPLDVTSGSTNGSIRQQTSRHLSIDKDPYKIPPKTPSGALEDAVKKLLALQNKIAGGENASGKGHVSSNSLAESTDTTKSESSTKSQQSDQALKISSESVPPIERDSNNESLQHFSRNPEHNSVEIASLNLSQGTNNQGLFKDKNKNDLYSFGNQDNSTKDTSVSLTSENVDSNVDKIQPEDETSSSALDNNKIANEKETEYFPNAEREKQESADGDCQENRVIDGHDTLETCSPSLTNEAKINDKQVTNSTENDNNSQDIYIDLMSPIIPRVATARRFRSQSDVHTTQDVGDVDTSTSNIDASVQNAHNTDRYEEYDPEPAKSADETKRALKYSQLESGSLCSTVPSTDAHCNEQENGSDTAANEQEEAVNDQEDVPLSSEDTMEEMQVEENPTSAIVTNVNDVKQLTCSTKPREMSGTHLDQEQLVTATSDGHRDPPGSVPVPSAQLKLEAYYGPCMSGVGQVDKNVDKEEQHQKLQMNPEAIPEQDFVYLNSTFQETPNIGDIGVTNKASSLKLPFPSSLVGRNVEGKNVSPILVDSDTNVESDNKDDTAANNKLSQPTTTSLLPVPRLALRGLNGNTVIMWDLPPDNKITDINFFEVCVFLVNKDGRARQNHGGQWIKIGEMKAMPLPMACTIRHLIQKNVVYFFIVRAVGHNGVPGPFSKPCCVACS